MREVRPARASDLRALEALYLHLNPRRPELDAKRATAILEEILTHPGCRLLVAVAARELVASCTLFLLPNLMRGGRPHAFLENVVTHAGHRRQGHGRAVVAAALAAAWEAGAHHVMLMSGRQDEGVRAFYESCGFRTGLKTGYVALAPGER
jgi:ribosomal protein S18 acetylase RimI-like enzyme